MGLRLCTILLVALLSGASCTVPSSGHARYGYLGLASINIGAASMAGLVGSCGILDLLKGAKRGDDTKFSGRCAWVALGLSVVGAGIGGLILSRAEYEGEPTGEDWAYVAAPTVIPGGLLAWAFLFESKKDDEYPTDGEIRKAADEAAAAKEAAEAAEAVGRK